MKRTVGIGHVHHHPQAQYDADAHQQDWQEGDAPQTRNGQIVHLPLIRHVEQALTMAKDEYPWNEQPSQDSRQEERHNHRIELHRRIIYHHVYLCFYFYSN